MTPDEWLLRTDAEILLFTTRLPPHAVVERLRRRVAPKASFLHPSIFSQSILFIGDIAPDHFHLIENSSLARRGQGVMIRGTILPFEAGSRISVCICPMLLEVLLSRLFLGGLVLWLLFLILTAPPPLWALIALGGAGGAVALLVRSRAHHAPPPYANLEGHFREIFLAQAPAQRWRATDQQARR